MLQVGRGNGQGDSVAGQVFRATVNPKFKEWDMALLTTPDWTGDL